MASEFHRVALSDGASLNVRFIAGVNDARPLVIALHGGPGGGNLNGTGFEFLADRYRVLLYDARGSGKSDVQGPFTHERWAADLDELRQWAGVDKCILAGASYGGFICLEYILRHPHRVTALLLRNTWASGFFGTMNVTKNMIASTRFKADPELVFRVWSGTIRDLADYEAAHVVAGVFFQPANPAPKPPQAEVAAVAESADQPQLNFEVHNFAFSHEQPRYDVRPRLSEITAPTLVVGGRQDIVTTPAQVEEIARGVQNGVAVILEHSGHNLHNDEPELFARTVREFLDRANI